MLNRMDVCVCVKLFERAWNTLFTEMESGFPRKQATRIIAVWLVISH